MTSHRLLVLLAALVLAVPACGDDDSATRTATSEVSTSTSSASETTVTRTTRTTVPTSTTTAATTTAPATTRPPATTTPPPTRPPVTVAPTTSAPPPTVPPPVTGDRRVFVLGDSCLLGAKETVPAALAGWVVTFDAVGSRRLPQGIEVLRARRSEIGSVVVIQQGNNYIAGEGAFSSQIDQAMTVLSGVQRVVWLTVAERWPSRVEINAAIRAAPARWPQIVVADWAPVIAAHPEYAADMLHLSGAGRQAIAQLIASRVGPPPG